MSDGPDLAGMYLATRERVVDLVDALGPADVDRPVPATPGWTVHDVLAHVVGLTDDALNDNMAGAPGPAWTAAQVAKRVGVPVVALLEEWAANVEAFAARVAAKSIVPPVVDLACHEQDLRGALGVPGARDNDVVRFATSVLVPVVTARAAEAGLPPLRVVLADGEVLGPADAEGATTLTTGRFELFRLMFGRRSVAQIEALDWSADPAPYLEHLTIFAPSALDIVE